MESAVTVKPCFVRLVRLKTIKSSQVKTISKSIAASRMKPTRKVIRCPVCNKLCESSSKLEIHIRVHTGERPFSCTICKQRFKSQSDMTQHSSKVHSDSRPFSCLWCDKSFKQSSVLMAHLRTHTKEKPYFCKKCPLLFSASSGLDYHALQKHNTGKGKKCEYCSKVFYTTFKLETHRRIHTGEKPYSCSVCGKSFANKSSLVCHSAVHLESRQFNCKKCPKTFRFQTNLNVHTLNVHEKVRPFPCEICGRTFSTKRNRDRHINSHLNEKPFKCPKCPKRFICRSTMVYHLKAIHDDIRDFKCSQCPLAYVDKARLNGHFLRKHANPNERTFACLFCSKKWCQPNEFEDHLRSHLGEEPYSCTLCLSSFTSGNGLRRHVVRVHKRNC